MNILAISPPNGSTFALNYVPLGLAGLLGVAEREGHEVTLVDFTNLGPQGLDYEDLRKIMRKKEFQVCLLSGFAPQVKGIKDAAEFVRQQQPHCKILIGGVGVSDIPEIALNYTGADACGIGESELTLPPLLQAIEQEQDYCDLAGFVYRRGDQFVKQPRGEVPRDLDALPRPAYHLFDIDFIAPRSTLNRGKRSLHLLTSRGCPFRCEYCINSLLNNQKMLTDIHGELEGKFSTAQRFRSVDSLVEEIGHLQSTYGLDNFFFADEEFITHRRRLEEVCTALEPLGITWGTSGRADWLTEDKLERVKRAGCQFLLYGVETGSQTMLDIMVKNAKIPAVERGIALSRKVGLSFISNFLIGHPGETEQTIRETIEFCKRNKLIYAPNIVQPYPNSKMFHDILDRIGDFDAYFAKLNNHTMQTDLNWNLSELSDAQLTKLRRQGIAETVAWLLAPDAAPEFLKRAFAQVLRLAVTVFEKMPLSFKLRLALRRLFEKRGRNQIPPNEFGRDAEIEDGYEESLQQLSADNATVQIANK